MSIRWKDLELNFNSSLKNFLTVQLFYSFLGIPPTLWDLALPHT